MVFPVGSSDIVLLWQFGQGLFLQPRRRRTWRGGGGGNMEVGGYHNNLYLCGSVEDYTDF